MPCNAKWSSLLTGRLNNLPQSSSCWPSARAYTPRKRLQCNPWTPGWLVPYSWFRRRRSFKYDSLNRITWYDDFTCLYCELSANEYLSCLSLSWPYWPHSWELKYAILWYSIPMPSCAYATLASGKAITLCSNIHKKTKRANLLDDAGQPLTHTERPYRNLSDIHMAVASGHNTLLWQLWFSTRSLFFTTACSFKRPWQKQHVESLKWDTWTKQTLIQKQHTNNGSKSGGPDIW